MVMSETVTILVGIEFRHNGHFMTTNKSSVGNPHSCFSLDCYCNL